MATEKLTRGWVTSLNKTQLEEYIREFGMEPELIVEDLRRQLSDFIKNGDHDEGRVNRLRELSQRHAKNKQSPVVEVNWEVITAMLQAEKERKPTSSADTEKDLEEASSEKTQEGSPKPEHKRNSQSERASAINTIRGWGETFDGSGDALEFITRLEELAAAYDIGLENITAAAVVILKGAALDWWRTNPEKIHDWATFKAQVTRYYVPADYRERAMERITRRQQYAQEPAKDYVRELRKMMSHTTLSEEQKLEWTYRNSTVEFKRYAKRSEVQSLQDYLRLTEEFEALGTQYPQQTQARTAGTPNTVLLDMRKGQHKNNRLLQKIRGKRKRRWETGGTPSANPDIPPETMIRFDGRKIIAQVKVAGVQVEGIVDTGATRSFISEKLADKLRQYGEVQPTDEVINLADGTTTTATEELRLKIELGERKAEITLLILDDVIGGILLGVDFLAQWDTTLRCGGLTTQLKPQTGKQQKHQKVGIAAAEPTEAEVEEFLKRQLKLMGEIHGTSHIAKHKIYMKHDRPLKQRYYPKNPAMQKIIHDLVEELLQQDLIEPSHSAYSSPVVLVKKKNNQWRLCIDYRQLNTHSERDAYPVPRMDHILNQLREAKYISTLDLKNGYWQIPMEENSKQYTAFTVPGRGLFQWKVMPFGLHTAPATFQRALDSVIGPEMEPFAFAYLDDIVVIGRTKREHLEKLHEVLARLRKANLRINPEKCHFFQDKLKYLGHVVSARGIHTDPDKIAAIKDLPEPTTTKQVHSFLGVASWYRRFVPRFTEIAKPLFELIKKNAKFEWTEEHGRATEELKKALTEAPVLACPDFTKTFILQTDASNCA
ncbi:uncharacterized protein [Drosophila kikkawai]|uniref:Reverse transcriptase n=1 Tax=Drosophila kikkawai TaxID=30033 RepID=A0ABM4GQU6_DROKI